MLQIQQLKLPVSHTKEDLEEKILKSLHIPKEELLSYRIVKQSLDARKKRAIQFVYTVEASTTNDKKIANRLCSGAVCLLETKPYQFLVSGLKGLSCRPVIVGCGPAGLFCAYMLAGAGYAPAVIERGRTMDMRKEDVELFWETGFLDPDSNVQFGEGGAGAFSDGKLNTLVKDTHGRSRKILDIFTEHGAPKEICYEAKPHIGTDKLSLVIPDMRRKIIENGGEFLFETCVTDIRIQDGRVTAIELNRKTWMDTQVLVLAIGHSARDTFSMLHTRGVPMEAKPFAVGLRAEHLQEMINRNQYGDFAGLLPPASYKLTAKGSHGRGVYSFCMCPGGYVVNASSEKKGVAVNGMSYHKRDSANANSAIIVSVTPNDYPDLGPLSGVAFQRKLEKGAFRLGDGAILQQLYGDFKRAQASKSYGGFSSVTRGGTQLGALHTLFGAEIYDSFLSGMEQFARKIPGFNCADTILSGVESRTSSPVRIHRDEAFQSSIQGLYPCGEGAGYAGGIMSAAIDGIKIAETIAKEFKPYDFG
ncbi:FAD-dependent oxidoreductase [Lachnospiraceae bacterium]|nr:FAD-dependent oxidoreductase [Lachnospiraceae bacterium]